LSNNSIHNDERAHQAVNLCMSTWGLHWFLTTGNRSLRLV